jgi:Acyl-CoA thioester hydrolase/BAAT N-terminal region
MTGAKAGATVRVEARAVDRDGRLWRSSTTVRADKLGQVALRGNRAMRLFWTLAPKADPPYIFIPKSTSFAVTLSARVRGRNLETTVTRTVRSAGVGSRMLTVARDGVYGELFTAARHVHPGVGVVVFGGSEGGLSTTEEASLTAGTARDTPSTTTRSPTPTHGRSSCNSCDRSDTHSRLRQCPYRRVGPPASALRRR